MKKLELLAPSGDWDSFLSAINNGADAIYLGLGEFNARAKSTYFTTENIAETVRYAHLRGVKIYVTINTLVSDDEMPDFIKLVSACVLAKVDAYIVQDFGCAKVLKEMFPKIELHASTQMGIHNLMGAKIAKDLGFSRVVLSREAKLEDIKEIASLGLEIEYFVQGALCVAFSGNCYFSALKHNMSGNRGKCLQLCRLPYQAYQDGKKVGDGYLLSARDLCMLNCLNELISAGVISFKIEGRLRRAGYVAQTVNTYRRAIDCITNCGKFDKNGEIKKLRQVFSRGDFNYRAYLDDGVPDDVINPINQNHLGLKIGELVSVERFKDLFKVGIKTNHPLKQGDGLKFCDKFGKELGSLGVGNVEQKGNINYIYTKHKLTAPLDVFLTLNYELESQVTSNVFRNTAEVEFVAKIGEPIRATARTSTPTRSEVTCVGEYICQPAKTSPNAESEILDIFGNLDSELFDTKVTRIELGNVFIPKSALKDLRRKLNDTIQAEILANFEANLPKMKQEKSLEEIRKNDEIRTKYANIIVVNESSDLSAVSLSQSDLVVFAPSIFSSENIAQNLDKLRGLSQNVGLMLPTVANTKDCGILAKIVRNLADDVPLLIQNAYGIELGRGHTLIAGTDMNIYNHFSVRALQDLGVSEFVWSKEISNKDPAIYEYAYGHQILMYFAHCPYKTLWKNTCQNCRYSPNLTLRDEAGKGYRILRHKISQCYFTLFANELSNKEKIQKKYIDLR